MLREKIVAFVLELLNAFDSDLDIMTDLMELRHYLNNVLTDSEFEQKINEILDEDVFQIIYEKNEEKLLKKFPSTKTFWLKCTDENKRTFWNWLAYLMREM